MKNAKILIVDDNETNRCILEESLADDYQLELVQSGEEALERAAQFEPDLVLLDIMMPGIDGYETCRRLRADLRLQHTKIVLVSAKSQVEERLAGYAAGADDYIGKPFDEEELRAKVRVFLRLKSAEEVNQLKRDLLSLIHHETRTPLNGLLGPAEILLNENLDDAERRMWAQTIRDSALDLLSFFEKATLLSVLTAGARPIEFTLVDLAVLVRALVARQAELAEAQGIAWVTRLAERAVVQGDAELIGRAISALLHNAVRFSPPGGPIEVELAEQAGMLQLCVRDSGPGIEHARLARVFEALHDGDVEHHSEGHSLSLAIARRIALAHGGSIAVESELGQGARFLLRLPLDTSGAAGGA